MRVLRPWHGAWHCAAAGWIVIGGRVDGARWVDRVWSVMFADGSGVRRDCYQRGFLFRCVGRAVARGLCAAYQG